MSWTHLRGMPATATMCRTRLSPELHPRTRSSRTRTAVVLACAARGLLHASFDRRIRLRSASFRSSSAVGNLRLVSTNQIVKPQWLSYLEQKWSEIRHIGLRCVAILLSISSVRTSLSFTRLRSSPLSTTTNKACRPFSTPTPW
ncbi:hypothetical protein BV25DRAFT_717519 [Artomyces pyxidatus]|uniref:Uncharacterized protein n=1 Tax=Artomyces pyxidatus TaxID=48021 RepID=A0ACB8SZW3_9AGAM|nr:hypothetical protein BV25DRAFT_717519 [Artomyces pyxidatus]